MSTHSYSSLVSRTGRVGMLAVVMMLAGAAMLSAHDFWIVPNAFAVAKNGTIEVRGQTGTTFPTSTSAVAPDRVAEARIVGASDEERIADLSVSDKSLVLRHRPSTAGQRIIAVALVSRSSRTTPASLKRYIALEGNAELAERYERESAYPTTDSLTQRATKFAKTFVEVGKGGPRAYSRDVGHALEFVPLNDPASLRPGDSLTVRLLYHGQPVVGGHLFAGSAYPEGAATTGESAMAAKDLSVATGADGIARIPLDRPGIWNVRTLHAAPASGVGSTPEWEVAFATLVVSVGGSGASRDQSVESNGEIAAGDRAKPVNGATDSVDVAVAIRRFHAALAEGDSAAALLLLVPEVVIMESGGVETRDDYRAHHLPGDIEFARAVKSDRSQIQVNVRGDVAWATSSSTTTGDYRGRTINSTGAELMVLTRTASGWRITAIHWSSRARR